MKSSPASSAIGKADSKSGSAASRLPLECPESAPLADRRMDDGPQSNAIDLSAVPLFPLPNVVLFPRAVLPLHIFEERYKAMTADALRGDRQIAMALLQAGLGEVLLPAARRSSRSSASARSSRTRSCRTGSTTSCSRATPAPASSARIAGKPVPPGDARAARRDRT